MSVPIARVKGRLSDLIRQAHREPVVITRRGRPDAVLLSFEEYERLRRLRAYLTMIHLSRELQDAQVTATDLHEAARQELEDRL